MINKKYSFIFLLFLVIGFLTFTGVSADLGTINDSDSKFIVVNDDNSTHSEDEEDEDEDGVDDEKESAYEREVEREITDYSFSIESELKNGTTKDKFELEFDVGETDNAEIEIKFQSESGNLETELKYAVEFDEIIEFIDTGTVGYDNETILTEYEIGKAGWEPLVYSENTTSGLIKINATTLDGIFSLYMRLSTGFVMDNDVIISPTSLKIDVIINEFVYASSGSKLAVKAHMKTSSEVKVDHESEDELEGVAKNETEVEVSDGNSTAFFSWSDFAYADGNLVDVITSSLTDSSDEKGEASSKMYYTFDVVDATKIIWDPKVGIISEASKQNLASVISDTVSQEGNTDAIAGFQFIALLVFILPIAIRRKIK